MKKYSVESKSFLDGLLEEFRPFLRNQTSDSADPRFFDWIEFESFSKCLFIGLFSFHNCRLGRIGVVVCGKVRILSGVPKFSVYSIDNPDEFRFILAEGWVEIEAKFGSEDLFRIRRRDGRDGIGINNPSF